MKVIKFHRSPLSAPLRQLNHPRLFFTRKLFAVVNNFRQLEESERERTRKRRDNPTLSLFGETASFLICAVPETPDRYNREEVVQSLGKEVNINPPLTLGQLPDTPEELLKLDQVFIKSELKVGVIYVQEGQYTEEEILDNNEESPLFNEFLQILGEKMRLKGFDKYKGGLDTVHDLTGLYSVYTNWRGIEIMFHVSTLLPYEKHDPQKVRFRILILFCC